MLDVPLTIKTDATQRLLREASEFSPRGVQGDGRWFEPFPLYVARAQGARLWDVDGNEFIDYHGAYGPAILGYNDPRVRAAIIDTMEREGILFAAPHPKEVELARLFAGLIPCAEMTVFCGGGASDALYNAVRVARAYTGRKRLLKFEGGYHGWHDYLAVSIRPDVDKAGPPDEPYPLPASAGSLEEITEQVIVAPFNDASAVERLVEREKDALAAIVIEPVCHSAGCLLPKEGFLKHLRQLCDAYGIVLVFDEVITGFRHHVGGVQTLAGVTPDLAAFGKAMASGFALSALSGKRRIMSLFAPEGPVLLSGTFMGNLLGVTASLATIRILMPGDIHKRLWQLGERIRDQLNATIDALGINARCYSYGGVWCLYFNRRVENFRDAVHGGHETQAKNQAFRHTLLNNGIYIQPRYHNRAYISAAHTDEDIDATIRVAREFLANHQAVLR
jgi:glutamate-1-semialdehyde 2,1-aminomutase